MDSRTRQILEDAKQNALAWTPDAEHVDVERMTWQSAAACIVGIFTDAMHAAECEGCAVKASNGFDPFDNLPFHNVFEVDHSPGAQMLRELQAQLQAQNELLTLLQTQRDVYKARLDALMNEGLTIDKTKYRLEFGPETEDEVRLRVIPIA